MHTDNAKFSIDNPRYFEGLLSCIVDKCGKDNPKDNPYTFSEEDYEIAKKRKDPEVAIKRYCIAANLIRIEFLEQKYNKNIYLECLLDSGSLSENKGAEYIKISLVCFIYDKVKKAYCKKYGS